MSEERVMLRWSLQMAAEEFGVARQTVKNHVVALGLSADEATYSTKQIVSALFGDKQQEQARLAKEQADRIAMDNQERRRNLIPVEDALMLARKFTFAAIAKLRGVETLSIEEKNAVIAEFRRLADADFTALPDADN